MGQRIMTRRKILRLTQDELAEKLGVSTQMISNLELGKKAIRPENLVKLCNTLGLSADFILNGSNISTNIDTITEKLIKLNDEELRIINELIDYMNKTK